MIDEKRLVTIENFQIPQLNRSRTIRVYLPKNYENSIETYPVLYMHDGQNLFYDNWSFSGNSWKACETLDFLHEKGLNQGIILVAVDNSNLRDGLGRLDEYSPWNKNFMEGRIDENWRSQLNYGGEGEYYADFFATTLKDFIDNNYRTKVDRANTFIGGSSMGALISLYIGVKYSEKYSKLALVSPAFWFAYENLKEFLEKFDLKNDLHIYMDMGTEETSDDSNPDFSNIYLDSVNGIKSILDKKIKKVDFKLFEGQKHTEKAWAERFPYIIQSFIGEK